ncbi:hypothetical protein GALMADRAFT_228941 [Galerina marginata CBS 339.88]|uniref:Uncharacterized protein n=1 Tax=Galerina marginata (strain CBS 339.88) TaxID=685588 RepID=A0A067T0W6_GALM3|nr:hypothetical protein GALMADRAFT_228941 [Galerina marginata CBS 339.88]
MLVLCELPVIGEVRGVETGMGGWVVLDKRKGVSERKGEAKARGERERERKAHTSDLRRTPGSSIVPTSHSAVPPSRSALAPSLSADPSNPSALSTSPSAVSPPR